MEGLASDRPSTARFSGSIGRLLRRFADPSTLLCCVFCTITLAYWSWSIAGSLTATGLVFLGLLPPTLFLLGLGLLGLIRFPTFPLHPFPIAFLVGSLAASFLLLFLNFFSPLSMKGNSVVVLVAAAMLQPWALESGDARVEKSSRWYSLLVVFLGLSASTLWTQDLRPHAIREGESVRFRPYVDCLVHAELVGQFCADRSILSLGDPDLAGQRLQFYHYASYLLPACVSSWTGQSAFESVLTFWIPFGFLLVGLAAYVLASGFWGSPAGIAAFIGVMLIPDSSNYGVRSVWYSFHWLCAISPGLLYGIAGGAFVALLITKGVRPTNWTWIVAGIGLAFLNVLLKAQVFVIEFPVLILWLLLFKESWSIRRRLAVGLAILAIGGLAIVVADVLAIGPLFLLLFRQHGIDEYLQSLASDIPAQSWGGFFAPLTGRKPVGRHPFRAILLVVTAPFEALIPAYFLLMVVSKFLKKLRPEDAIPALTLVFYLYLVFWTPRNNRGSPDELWHRPFVWVYFLLAVWTWGKLSTGVTASRFVMPRLLPIALTIAGTALLVVPWQLGKNVQNSGRVKAQEFRSFVIPSDLLACADFLREHSGRLDVIQNGVPDRRLKPAIPEPILGGFAERRCYLGRQLEHWSAIAAGSPGESESIRRDKILDSLRKSSSMNSLIDHARQTGIRWYVAHPSEVLRWPPEFLDHPAFVSGRYRVYEFKPDAR
jgi:hypothetical protein